jgi:CheY-like chemotaxis protein
MTVSSANRILVIDDDDCIREVTQTCLELVGGYEVLTAASGQEGLAAARARPPHAILLDVMMPGLDGPGTFARLQEHPETQDVPVILLTAKAQGADRDRFAELGVAGVIVKPFNPMELARQVAQTLGWQE